MRRISWTPGMRLTADIMRDADNKVEEFVSKSFMLGAAGRFGLLPSTRPFKLALDFTQDCIKVTALSCLGLTRGGNLIDVNFDTDFTRNFDNRVSYPEDPETYLLIIRTEPNKRMEISEGIEETLYSFKLTPQRTRVEDNELPIGRVIFENGWQLDEVNFVPPCLFVSSCRAYEELAESFSRKIDEIDEETRKVHSSENRNVISVYWPLIRQLQIVMGKERELMTPMGLFSNVQKCLTAFICAFDLFNTQTLDNEAKQQFNELNAVARAPYNYENAYLQIKGALGKCNLIIEQVKALAGVSQSIPDPEPTRTNSQSQPPAPVVPEKELEKECIKPETIITFIYKDLAADIFFTTDGSKPNNGDSKAIKGRNGFAIKFDNGFRKEKGKEDDRHIVLKLVALVNGLYSSVTTQTIILHKSLSFIDAIKI